MGMVDSIKNKISTKVEEIKQDSKDRKQFRQEIKAEVKEARREEQKQQAIDTAIHKEKVRGETKREMTTTRAKNNKGGDLASFFGGSPNKPKKETNMEDILNIKLFE